MQINEEIKKGRELDSPSSWVLTAHALGAEPLLATRRLTPRSCTIQARALCPDEMPEIIIVDNNRNTYFLCPRRFLHLLSDFEILLDSPALPGARASSSPGA